MNAPIAYPRRVLTFIVIWATAWPVVLSLSVWAVLWLRTDTEKHEKVDLPIAPGASTSKLDILNATDAIFDMRLDAIDAELSALARLLPSSSPLRSDSDGYGRVCNNHGMFLVRLHAITPFGDGQRVEFDIGNPYLCTFTGLTVNVAYGKRRPEGATPEALDEWQTALKQKTITAPENSEPGWTTIGFVVAPAAAEDVAFLDISFDFGGVKLTTNP